MAAASFNPEVAAQSYFAQHKAGCRETACSMETNHFWGLIDDAVMILGLGIFTVSGLAAEIVRRTKRLTSRRLVQAVIYAIIGTLIWRILYLPFAYYAERVANEANPLSDPAATAKTITVGNLPVKPDDLMGWLIYTLSDGLAVSLAVAFLCIFALLHVGPKLGRRHWTVPVMVALAAGSYSLYAQVDNWNKVYGSSEPLLGSETGTLIPVLAERHGISARNVRVSIADFSALGFENAQAVGWGKDKAIIFSSSLMPNSRFSQIIDGQTLKPAPRAELVALAGHEIAHHNNNDTLWLTLIGVVLSGAMPGFFIYLAGRYLSNSGQRFGIAVPLAPAAYPLYSAALLMAFLLSMMASNIIQSYFETRADRAGLDITRNPDAFAQLMLRLHARHPLELSRTSEFLLSSHPSGMNRIREAMIWKAAHLGEKPPSYTIPHATINKEIRAIEGDPPNTVKCVRSGDPIPKTKCIRVEPNAPAR